MATQDVQMKFLGVQIATFDENPHENERIGVILGCAICFIACAKHRCTGGWLKLWFVHFWTFYKFEHQLEGNVVWIFSGFSENYLV